MHRTPPAQILDAFFSCVNCVVTTKVFPTLYPPISTRVEYNIVETSQTFKLRPMKICDRRQPSAFHFYYIVCGASVLHECRRCILLLFYNTLSNSKNGAMVKYNLNIILLSMGSFLVSINFKNFTPYIPYHTALQYICKWKENEKCGTQEQRKWKKKHENFIGNSNYFGNTQIL